MTPLSNRFLHIQARRRYQLQQSVQQTLEVYHYPRLVMLGLILITALSAFLLSFGLRMAGVTDLALRYLIVWVLVYLLFIGLARLWAGWQLSNKDSSFDADISELIPDGDGFNGDSNTGDYVGSGGQFSGSGAKGSWGDSSSSSTNSANSLVTKKFSSHSNSTGGSTSKSDSLFDGLDFDLGDAGLPIVLVLAFLAVIVSALGGFAWMSYSLIETAPILLAELLVDLMIVNGLGRRLRIVHANGEHWFFTVWKRTQKFFWLIVAVIVGLFLVLHFGHIEVQTIGDLIKLF